MHTGIGVLGRPCGAPQPRCPSLMPEAALGETNLEAGLPGGGEEPCLGLPEGPRGCSHQGSSGPGGDPCAMAVTEVTKAMEVGSC